MIAAHTVKTNGTVANPEAAQCTKLIRKLRWIGLDEEARRLEQALRILDPDQRGTVIAEPRITD